MNYRRSIVWIVGAALILGNVAQAEPTLEQIEKDLTKKWEKVESLSSKMKMVGDMQGMTMKAEGTMEYMKKDDKELLRVEMEMTMNSPQGEQKMPSTSISDGEFVYTLTEMMGQQMAMKQKISAMNGAAGGAQMFEQLREQFELKALSSETVDGKDVYVLEGTSKQQSMQNPFKKARFYFATDTGMFLKMSGFDDTGKEVMTMSYSDVKVNPKLDPERFVFKAPEGVQVMDMTNMPGMGG